MCQFKSLDTQFFERRQDYHDTMAVHNFNSDEMRGCIHQVYEDMDESKEKMKKDIVEDAKTRWLVSRI